MSAPTLTRQKQMVGVGDAAERLGVSVWTLRSWCYKGRCSSYKIGSRLMLDEGEVERIISESERPRLVSLK